VAPAEVEAALQAFPGVLDAAVIEVPDEEAGEVPLSFVVVAAGVEVTQIYEHLRGQLAAFKLPK
jgi:acyl-coenzyme A synthetase/AMP-(fatty) acid ligase